MRAKDLRDKEAPTWKTPITDRVEPSREKLRIANVDPKIVKSSTDKEEPIVARPKSENAAPKRAKDLTDIADPSTK